MIKLKRITLIRAVVKWGETAQMLKMSEECNELARAVLRRLNGYDELDNLVEEIVDVEIMLQQLKFMLGEKHVDFPTRYWKVETEKHISLGKKLEEEMRA